MKRCAIACGILALLFCCGACQKKEDTLSLLVWEGYADPSFVRAFEQAHHCKVVATYMGTSDELVAKLRGGSAANYDVISPSSDVAASIAHSGLAAPLDIAQLPAYAQLSAKLRDMPLVKFDGKIYGVPFMWGPNPLLYDNYGVRATAGVLERFVGSETEGQSFRVGRSFHHIHGRANSRLRSARPCAALQPFRRANWKPSRRNCSS